MWVQSLGPDDPPGRRHGNPLLYSCLENPHGQRSLAGYSPWVKKSRTRLKQLGTHTPGQAGNLTLLQELTRFPSSFCFVAVPSL